MGKELKMIDLFAGCGGLSLGLEQAGFHPVLVSEISKDAMNTYLANRPTENLKIEYDIYKLSNEKIDSYLQEWGEDIDLVAGGPPCQGYSGIGHRRTFDLDRKDIPSNQLYVEMKRVIEKVKPKVFLFENVKGLLSGRWTKSGEKGEIWADIKDAMCSIDGYVTRHSLVQAKNYGVPQNRPRVLLAGIRQDLVNCPSESCSENAIDAEILPKKTKGAPPHLQELLGDLIDPSYHPGQDRTSKYLSKPLTSFQRKLRSKNGKLILRKGSVLTQQEYSSHKPQIVEKFQWMIDHKEWTKDDFPEKWKTKKFAQRLLHPKWKDEPNITATSLADDYVHYCQPRVLTVREWARLQMFPDWYEFKGPRTTGGRRRAGDPSAGIWDRDVPRYTQIGNAVPVKLAEEVGNHFKEKFL